MRSNMKPLAPATSTLAPTVAHIAGTAEQLAFKTADSPRAEKKGGQTVTVKRGDEEEDAKRRKDRATIRWVLDAPRRIRESGPEEAEWDTVRRLLENWHGAGVPGIEKVKVACERAVEEREAVKV
jgi:vacuolar protein sorting-associated protein 51